MYKFIFFMMLNFIAPCLAQDATRGSGSLVVFLEGFETQSGVLRIALCNSREDYESGDQAFRSILTPVEVGTSVAIFDSLPHGEYAIKAYHDENDNEELDTNFFGAPSEAYGFSNNARGTFGPADWDDAKFFFSAQSDTIMITLE